MDAEWVPDRNSRFLRECGYYFGAAQTALDAEECFKDLCTYEGAPVHNLMLYIGADPPKNCLAAALLDKEDPPLYAALLLIDREGKDAATDEHDESGKPYVAYWRLKGCMLGRALEHIPRA